MITSDILSGGAAILLTLLFSYVPGLNTKYAALSNEKKQLIMLGLLVLTTLGAFGLSCLGWLDELFGATLTCDQAGALALVRSFVVAIMANQSVFKISPKTPAVRQANA